MKYFTQEEQKALEILIHDEILSERNNAVIDEDTLINILRKIHYLDNFMEHINLDYGIPESIIEIKKTKPVKAWKKEDK